MSVPVEIDFRNIDPSEFITNKIQERVGRLERRFERIKGCHVTVEAPHHHHRRGNLYHIRVIMHLPGTELVVSRDPGANHAHRDIYVAIRDAFDAAERKLVEHVDKMNEEVKVHRLVASE